jgi:hypothetical protein
VKAKPSETHNSGKTTTTTTTTATMGLDRDTLVTIGSMSIASNAVTGLETHDLIHLAFDRFGPFSVSILTVESVGFLDITRNTHSKLVSDVMFASLARVNHAFHELDVTLHSTDSLPTVGL